MILLLYDENAYGFINIENIECKAKPHFCIIASIINWKTICKLATKKVKEKNILHICRESW